MSLQKTKGIVLHHIKYGETSIIATIYTEEFGRQAYIVKGARSKKTKLKANMFQPFFHLDMEVYHKPGRDLQSIKEAKNYLPIFNIYNSIKKSTVCLFLSEVLYKSLREEEKNKELFSFISNSIRYLDGAEGFPLNYHLVFMLHLSRFLGFYPNGNYSDQNAIFDLKEGHFVQSIPDHKHYMSKHESFCFWELLNAEYDSDITFPSIKLRPLLLDEILDFYRLHHDRIGEIKSLEVLREVFRPT